MLSLGGAARGGSWHQLRTCILGSLEVCGQVLWAKSRDVAPSWLRHCKIPCDA